MHVVVFVVSRIHTSVRIEQVALTVLLAVFESSGVYGSVLIYIPTMPIHTAILTIILPVVSNYREYLNSTY